ncbi:uncharacterized protein PGTG_15011 [Puccinia graminis f. sp. tritici CRL 75-36-700-3]|uniref:Uncharacterized protein n=1 Tax=Puccinia graminis f. sp. tritici (strain CRL 75-36-700-3 / race SCCL) TaxID=418459 RepID=E3KY90_PUCGT|nr:uncharacterized protein PGTG_15011 [Puccinia graminis f. sp. tritici CRL 75-36-700-3]EFP89170.1 hypothetical protein PGTG_15011 [Puccinia graminis f. sp. tritici CRL 75-36-700-3]
MRPPQPETCVKFGKYIATKSISLTKTSNVTIPPPFRGPAVAELPPKGAGWVQSVPLAWLFLLNFWDFNTITVQVLFWLPRPWCGSRCLPAARQGLAEPPCGERPLTKEWRGLQ